MNQYNKDSVCPKCNFALVASDYIGPVWNDGDIYTAHRRNSYGVKPEIPIPEREIIQSEYVKRTCCNCKYQWKEGVLTSGGYDDFIAQRF